MTAELCGVFPPSLRFMWRFGFKEVVQQGAVRVPKEPWAGHWVHAVAQRMARGRIQRL